MNGLTRSECVDWMRQHLPRGVQFQQGTDLPQLALVGYFVSNFPLPQDSGQKSAFARRAYSILEAEPNVLIAVLNANIFPSSGHLPLLGAVRRSLGELRGIDEVPGHLFTRAEAEDAVSILILAMQFFWDCLVVGQTGKVVLYVSHDEYLDVLSPDNAVIQEFKALI